MEPTPVKEKNRAYFRNLPQSELLRAADSSWRICAIWELLKEGSWTVQEMADILDFEPSTVKTHLKRFRLAGLAEVVGRVRVGNHYPYKWSRKRGQSFDPSQRPIPKSGVSRSSLGDTTVE